MFACFGGNNDWGSPTYEDSMFPWSFLMGSPPFHPWGWSFLCRFHGVAGVRCARRSSARRSTPNSWSQRTFRSAGGWWLQLVDGWNGRKRGWEVHTKLDKNLNWRALDASLIWTKPTEHGWVSRADMLPGIGEGSISGQTTPDTTFDLLSE